MGKPPKARHIDFYPDEYIAGISGKMTPEQLGLYWTICALIYSKSAPIDDDPKWLGNVMGGTNTRTVKRILSALVAMGKVECKDGLLWVNRCARELDRTHERISNAQANGKLGGRPSNKSKGLPKAGGSSSEKLTTNHQPPTTNHQPKNAPNGFDDFWKEYPRKVGKGSARKAYTNALKTASPEEILAGVKRYVATSPDPKFTKHPGPWLNDQRWLDEDKADKPWKPMSRADTDAMWERINAEQAAKGNATEDAK